MRVCLKRNGLSVAGIVCMVLVTNTAAVNTAAVSPVGLAADAEGKIVYVAQADAQRIAELDAGTGRVTAEIALPIRPSGICLSPSTNRLYVTGGLAKGEVLAIDLAARKVASRFTAGHSPVAPVLSPDGKTLYVCNRFTDSVSIFSLTMGRKVTDVDVIREPVAAAVTPDGRRLLVLNLLPRSRADGEYTAAAVSVIDPAAEQVVKTLEFINGSNQLRGICLSPDGKYAYVTHVLARYQSPTTQLARGWINTNALTVIDVAAMKIVNTVLLDDVDLGAANPWGVACTPDGRWLCVAHAGTDEITVIDKESLHRRLDRAAAGQEVTAVARSAEDVPNDLSFLTPIKRRIQLPGKGPRDLAIIGSTAYVAEYFSDSVAMIDVSKPAPPQVRSVALGAGMMMSAARKGQMLFNDANLCFQKWQSCASCHTDEARVDALNWDLLNDGLGNPKNTKSLLLSHRTPPAMSLGVRATAEMAVRAGIRHIQFAVRPESDAEAIDAYLKSLEPLASPHLVNGELSAGAERGKVLFDKAGCARCHPAPLYTNMNAYDVGTGIGMHEAAKFDTPTLIELWRSGPYLHDGRAASLRNVITTFNASDAHGATSNLSEAQVADLEAYLLSL